MCSKLSELFPERSNEFRIYDLIFIIDTSIKFNLYINNEIHNISIIFKRVTAHLSKLHYRFFFKFARSIDRFLTDCVLDVVNHHSLTIRQITSSIP